VGFLPLTISVLGVLYQRFSRRSHLRINLNVG
jgi:hypothetical protein